VQLFGREVLMAGGAARLALRANVPMVPCFMTADRTGMHCHFLDPIPCPPGRGRAAAQAMTQQFATQFEQLVRRYPEHWFVFHPVFDVPPNHCADPLRRRLQAQARDAATTRDREAICAS
jgi:lauroyl/myristoyl acyltransferase